VARPAHRRRRRAARPAVRATRQRRSHEQATHAIECEQLDETNDVKLEPAADRTEEVRAQANVCAQGDVCAQGNQVHGAQGNQVHGAQAHRVAVAS
jgi:hypothetical protein